MFYSKKRYFCNKADISAMNALSLQTVSPNTQGYCCQYTDRSKDAPVDKGSTGKYLHNFFTHNKDGNISHCQAEEEEVGGCSHGKVPEIEK